MLGTLIKYEFKAVGRLLLPLYGAWLIAAVMLGLSIGNAGAGSPLFIALSGILYGGAAMVSVVLTCILLIQRFYKNLLGNEGYLTFALPVSTGNHLINKILSGAVWGTAGLIVAIFSGLLIAACIEGFDTVFENFKFIAFESEVLMQDKINFGLIILEVFLVILVAFAETAAKVYAAIAVGHQWSNHRVLGAIAAFIGFGIIESVVGNLIGEIFDTGAADGALNMTVNMSEMAQVHLVMVLVIVLCAVVAAIYGFVAWKLLDKRLNLE